MIFLCAILFLSFNTYAMEFPNYFSSIPRYTVRAKKPNDEKLGQDIIYNAKNQQDLKKKIEADGFGTVITTDYQDQSRATVKVTPEEYETWNTLAKGVDTLRLMLLSEEVHSLILDNTLQTIQATHALQDALDRCAPLCYARGIWHNFSNIILQEHTNNQLRYAACCTFIKQLNASRSSPSEETPNSNNIFFNTALTRLNYEDPALFTQDKATLLFNHPTLSPVDFLLSLAHPERYIGPVVPTQSKVAATFVAIMGFLTAAAWWHHHKKRKKAVNEKKPIAHPVDVPIAAA